MITEFNQFLSAINSSTSSNSKIDTIRNTSDFVQKVIYYTYNPYFHFGVSSKNAKKRKDLCDQQYSKDLFQLLNELKDRDITGHKAISAVNGFVYNNPDHEDLLHFVLDKDLKIRAGAKIINKAIPGTIPEFSVALAENYNDKTVSKIKFDREWYISRKLDGVRCIIIVDETGNVSSYSRSGKRFETLSVIEDQIKSIGLKSKVFDGEVCKYAENDKDDFQSVMKEIRRKNHTITDAVYSVFDFVSLSDFNSKTSTEKLNRRLFNLRSILFNNKLDNVEILNQFPVKSLEELRIYIDDFKKDQNRNHWEGLIVRKDESYKGKRSRDILKVKTFFDAEYRVKSVIFGPFRHVVNGVEVEEEMLSAVTIEHKGNEVQVGSGFSIEQRKQFFSYPEDIIDHVITVQYFEESQNQLGENSLRFPVVKIIHGKERHV